MVGMHSASSGRPAALGATGAERCCVRSLRSDIRSPDQAQRVGRLRERLRQRAPSQILPAALWVGLATGRRHRRVWRCVSFRQLRFIVLALADRS